MNPETQVPRVRVSDVGRHEGETVEIAGWLYNLRRSGKICFPQVRDGSGLIQCVAVKSALPEELFETLKDLTQESSLIIRGKVRAEARAQGGFELDVESENHERRLKELARDNPALGMAIDQAPESSIFFHARRGGSGRGLVGGMGRTDPQQREADHRPHPPRRLSCPLAAHRRQRQPAARHDHRRRERRAPPVDRTW